MKTEPVGRPALVKGQKTVRVGFSVNESLWKWFARESDRRGLSYSEYFRKTVEKMKRTGR